MMAPFVAGRFQLGEMDPGLISRGAGVGTLYVQLTDQYDTVEGALTDLDAWCLMAWLADYFRQRMLQCPTESPAPSPGRPGTST